MTELALVLAFLVLVLALARGSVDRPSCKCKPPKEETK
jgi:hypothetical protein